MNREDLATVMGIVSKLDMDGIQRMYELLKHRQSNIQYHATFNFDNGDRVQFNGKYGRKIVGSITKINQKTIKVKADDTGVMWTVSPSLLSKAI
jgi:hypothetical protein